MRKLISAHFSRLWKEKVFWINAGLIFIFSAIMMWNGCRQVSAMKFSGSSADMDRYYFNFVPVLGLFLAEFISLFLGKEYSDGTIRNKIVAGHTRASIYFSNFVVCFAAGFIFMLMWMLGGLIGIPFLGTWKMGIKGFFLYFLIASFFLEAFTGIFVLLSMMLTNRATAAVFEIMLFLALLIVASMIYNSLCEPESISGVIMTANGMEMSDPSPNPVYISGMMRTVYEWILDFLPTGQGILMANVEIVHPFREIVCSILITLCTTAVGVFAFYKKNLK